jgi:hypothetical protein
LKISDILLYFIRGGPLTTKIQLNLATCPSFIVVGYSGTWPTAQVILLLVQRNLATCPSDIVVGYSGTWPRAEAGLQEQVRPGVQ